MTTSTPTVRHVRDVLTGNVEAGDAPGLVAVLARGDDAEIVVLGDLGPGRGPMTQDALFRIASIGKPITAVATLLLVDDGVLALDDPVDDLLPELVGCRVLRDPSGPLDDTVAMARPVTLRDLLRSTSGHGFGPDFESPVFCALLERLRHGPPQPSAVPPPDEWMATLHDVPMTFQPGEAFVYNTAFDVLGVLLARATGRSFGEVLRARVFDPLGMADTGFVLPAGATARTTTSVRRGDDGALVEVDGPDGEWVAPPAFESGAGGLVSTAADLLAFWRALARGGAGLVPEPLVAAMTADQLGRELAATNPIFLDGQSWGYGCGVDVERRQPWNVPGRFGWVGGTGTSAYVVPSDGSIAILLTQAELTGPSGNPVLESFWRAAASYFGH